jgi:putative hemolysin
LGINISLFLSLPKTNKTMHQLISPSQIAKAVKLDKFGKAGTAAGWLLMHLLGMQKINSIYNRISHFEKLEFINAIIKQLNIDFEIPEEDLKRIPKNGAFITVSNHPLGGLDGVLLLKIILEQRPDYKVLSSFILKNIPQLKPYLIHLDQKNEQSISGLKNALTYLSEGHGLGLFPAGEVSTYKDGKLLIDKTWNSQALKLIYKAEVPIIPVYFHGRNSRLFYLLSRLHPKLRTAKLPSEAISDMKKTIKVRIGKPITPKMQESFADHNMLGEFIRKKTYILAKTFEPKKLYERIKIKPDKPNKKIIDAIPVEKLLEDIRHLNDKDDKMFEKNEYTGYLSDAKDIPNILKEIGRLREITFRDVGEGTGMEIDLDKYDKYYKHLILWDNKANKLVGAYRMGLGREIFDKHGIKGFYLSELFTFEPELYEMMSKSIEMGRAFIIKEYQQKPFPLFLLWRGIVHTTLRYPDHEYLIGPVSISNKFSNFSKSLMIEFMKSYFYDPYTAQFVRPNKAFKIRLKEEDKTFVFDAAGDNLTKFDKLIDELEPENLKIPVLLKKYIKQNARLIAFNVDPNFNNAIDGLMYIKISDLPEDTVKPVLEEFEKQLNKKEKS